MLVHTHCPLGGREENDVEVFPANFDPGRMDAATFSARRMPDRLHYRMVRNTETGCLRADPVLDSETLRALYRASGFTYEDLAPHILKVYMKYADRVWPILPDYRGVLEIGCGNGFFLENAAKKGFEKAVGIEPSDTARSGASPEIRDCILPGVPAPGLLPAESLSLICGFQVLDHLDNPNEVLAVCRDALAPGGIMYWICHDSGSWSFRLLGSRSPILDVEHVVLYDKKTVGKLFAKNGYEVLDVFGVANGYPLSYWLKLAPLPNRLKLWLGRLLEVTGAGRMILQANLGNLGIIARKPAVK